VSTSAARTHAGRLVTALGIPVTDPDGGLTHLFPRPAQLLADEAVTAGLLAMPASRRDTLLGLARALADGDVVLDAGAGRAAARAALAALPGIGPWTVETVAMRALGDPDAFLPGDLGVRQAARRLGLPASPAALEQESRAWSPWRAYAVQHLWATGTHAVNQLPDTDLPDRPRNPLHASEVL
jgi:AraC family transcriptional regulator of adaptative response / DNA-3-methyladenine glycosylase II